MFKKIIAGAVTLMTLYSCAMPTNERKMDDAKPVISETRAPADQSLLTKWNLGMGYNIITGENKGFAFAPENQVGVTLDLPSNYIRSTSKITNQQEYNSFMSQSLKLDVAVDYDGVDANFGLDKQLKDAVRFNSNSKVMVKSVKYTHQRIQLSDPGMYTDLAKERMSNFANYYGDSYLSYVETGASLYYIYRVSTSDGSSISESTLNAALDVKYKEVVEGSLDFSSSSITESEYNKLSITVDLVTDLFMPLSSVKTTDEYNTVERLFEDYVTNPSSNFFMIGAQYSSYPEVPATYKNNLSNLSKWKSLRNRINAIHTDAINIYKDQALITDCVNALQDIDAVIAGFNLMAATTSAPGAQYDSILNYSTQLIDGNQPLTVQEGILTSLNFEQNLTDSSGNGNDGEVYQGSVQYTSNGIQSGTALDLTASGATARLSLGENSTMSLWFKADYTTAHQSLISQDAVSGSSTDHSRGISLMNGTVHFWSRDHRGNWRYVDFTAQEGIKWNEWNHAVLVQEGNVLKGFLNGKSKTFTMSGNRGRYYFNRYTIGRYTGSSYYYKGLIDDVKIYNRALTNQSVVNLYNNSSDPTHNMGLAAAYNFNKDFNDISGNNNNGTAHNGITRASGRNYGGALSLDGSNDYLEVITGANTTISLWINPFDISSHQSVIAQQYNGSHGRGIRISGGNLYVWTRNSGTSWKEINLGAISVNTLTHVALVQDGNKFYGYKNGQYAGTYDMGSNMGHRYLSYYTLGRYTDTTYYYNGYMDKTHIYSRALTGDEISNIYHEEKPLLQ